MTKCYFYNDPLAAAWMFQRYGMRFYFRYGDGTETALRGLGNFLARADGSMGNEKFYVHPTSLRLLNPQVGDLVRGLNSGLHEIVADKVYDKCPNTRRLSRLITLPQVQNDNADNTYRIIQRKGIAFMWPESDES